MAYQSINPFDGKVLKTFDSITDSALESALVTANVCFESWRLKTFGQRAVIVSRAATIMRKHLDDFAHLATLEMGKLIEEARGEVRLSADILDYYAENAEQFLAAEPLAPSSGEASIESTPLGILFGVQPWNFPYYQLDNLGTSVHRSGSSATTRTS